MGRQQRPPATFTDGKPLPKLVIFDLDYTLWPFWCDTHVSGPVRDAGHPDGTTARDARGATYAFYPEVAPVLAALRARAIPVAAASRTHAPDIAEQLLRTLRVPGAPPPPQQQSDSASETCSAGAAAPSAWSLFAHAEIYPRDKTAHMRRIRGESGVAYEDMLFFDDESRNRVVEKELGVLMWLVRDGLTRDEVDRGVRRWRERNRRTEVEEK